MLNSVNLLGRLTAKPELRKTASNLSVISFTIAVQRPTQEKETDFIDCVAWRNTAEFITTYFDKGQMIAVEGRLQTRQYHDNKKDTNVKVCEVIVDKAHFCGAKEVKESCLKPVEMVEVPDEILPF